jgi:hypothetical protein
MSDDEAAASFKATYAEHYERYLIPLLFEPYARILADRAEALAATNVLAIREGFVA